MHSADLEIYQIQDKNSTSRNYHVDNAKSLGVFLVILGHVWSAPPELLKWIYSFHMPAFFILSGYFFDPDKVKRNGRASYMLRRAKRLMVPYMFFGFACAVPWILAGKGVSQFQFFKRIVGTLYSVPTLDFNFNCTPIWFLSCMVCVSVIAVALIGFPKKVRIILSIIFLCIGWATPTASTFYWPWCLNAAFTGLFFFSIGIALQQVKYFSMPRLPLVILALLLVGTILFNHLNPQKVYVGVNQLGNPIYFLCGALSGSLFLFEVSKRIPGNIKVLDLFGRNTLVILGANYWMHDFSRDILALFDARIWWLNFPLQIILFVILIIVVESSPLLMRLTGGVMRHSK